MGTTKLYSLQFLLLSCGPESSYTSFLVRINNSHPCQDLNPGPPWYQADMLPIELSWLLPNIAFRLIGTSTTFS